MTWRWKKMFVFQFLISILLFMVLFFGIGFILNMLLKTSWIMAIFYPIIVIMIVDNQSSLDYFTQPQDAVHQAIQRIISLAPSDVTILSVGFVGAIISGVVIKMLRQNGYQMF